MNYRRSFIPGGAYFFTVVTAGRHPIFRNGEAVDVLRHAVRRVNQTRPFVVDAMVVLPDHLHCIWTLPPGDDDYPTRWRLIKTWVAKHQILARGHSVGQRRPVWQARYWEHTVRDERNYRQHVEYIHHNPVQHGYVRRAADWAYSSFRRYVKAGLYPEDWGGVEPVLDDGIGHE